MQDIYDIVKNVEGIYESDTGFQILKDFALKYIME